MSGLGQRGSSTQQEILGCRRPRKKLRNPPTGVDLVPAALTLLDGLIPRRSSLRSDRRPGNRGASPSRSPFLIECQGTERSLNALRRAAHNAGVEVSGSAASVPRLGFPTKGRRIAAPISVAPSPRCCRDVHELPSEGTAIFAETASVSSDRAARSFLGDPTRDEVRSATRREPASTVGQDGHGYRVTTSTRFGVSVAPAPPISDKEASRFLQTHRSLMT